MPGFRVGTTGVDCDVLHMWSRLFGRRTWEEAIFLLSAAPLGTLWFAIFLTTWSLGLGLAVTPLVIPIAFGMPFLIVASAGAEAALARRLLGVNVYPPHAPLARGGFWRRCFGWLADPAMWRAQAYLLLRAALGFPLAIGMSVLLGLSLGGIAAPFYYWSLNDGIKIDSWRVDTLPEALLLVVAGAAGLVITMLLLRLLARPQRALAESLLERSPDPAEGRDTPTLSERRQLLVARGATLAFAFVVLVVIWALTGHGYFWPVWPLLAFLLVLGLQSWRLFVDENPERWRRPGLDRSIGLQIGSSALVFLFLVGVWAVSSGGTFWPVWPLLGLTITVLARAGTLYFSPPGQEELTQRIDVLTTTRAGAVDQQEAELRRIERDLHDGAQARLVALGMSIGMAEQKLAEDPEGARELLEEARAGAGQALKELRDLARGIHPPVLADRGLEAAVTALADASPLRVQVHTEIPQRPSAPVESAAYFVVAEALANATKHSQARRVDIRMIRDGEMLSVEVADDGVGGADTDGSGLSGLRRRVEALDGTLRVASPAGGPTVVRAEMPCG
jgi:signal transduction histidine kinase